jgi:hypothetical protein
MTRWARAQVEQLLHEWQTKPHTYTTLAARFGVSKSAVAGVINRYLGPDQGYAGPLPKRRAPRTAGPRKMTSWDLELTETWGARKARLARERGG